VSNNLPPMIGQRFGRLVVVAEPPPQGKHRKVVCWCDCGAEKNVRVDHLRVGRSATCGTCNRSMDRLKSVVGQVFGKLTVIDEPEICRNRRVTCRCECGHVVSRLLSNLKRGQTKSCGCTKWYDHEHGYVYYLFDPIDMRLRYIGQSVQQPGVRVSGHLYGSKPRGRSVNCTEKKEWIRNLKPYRPAVWIAESDIPVAELDRHEQRHIADALTRGDDLLNIHHARAMA
jgi:hypothetical protein